MRAFKGNWSGTKAYFFTTSTQKLKFSGRKGRLSAGLWLRLTFMFNNRLISRRFMVGNWMRAFIYLVNFSCIILHSHIFPLVIMRVKYGAISTRKCTFLHTHSQQLIFFLLYLFFEKCENPLKCCCSYHQHISKWG